MAIIDKIRIGNQVYDIAGSGNAVNEIDDVSYRWQYVAGEISSNSLFNHKTNTVEATQLYTTIRYVLNGEKKIRFSGSNSGSSSKLAYAFLGENGTVVSIPEFVSGKLYRDVVLDVPNGAYEVRINGGNYVSPHLEVAVEDLRADIRTLPYLLDDFGRRLQYKENFAWKPMPKAHIAFTYDDSLEDTASIVDMFVRKGVPCCFGAIPEKLNMGLSNGETIAQAMKRGVDAVGCEVLAHGSAGYEIVTEENIDNMDFLYNKFVVNKKKFEDFGFVVRGTVRVGGSGNICNDARTDEWVRLFFDYGDLYGIEEPHNHSRFSGTTYEDYKNAIDKAIKNKTFCPLLFHSAPEWTETLIDYAIEQGAVISNYADVYDTYGSTEEMVAIENRISAIEQNDGNEVKY